MGERHNCKTGREIVVGDRLCLGQDIVLVVQGFGPHDDHCETSGRSAVVTSDNGSLLKGFYLYDNLFYQLC